MFQKNQLSQVPSKISYIAISQMANGKTKISTFESSVEVGIDVRIYVLIDFQRKDRQLDEQQNDDVFDCAPVVGANEQQRINPTQQLAAFTIKITNLNLLVE